MLRSKKYKFLFIHIPKSAGTSIHFALKPFSDPFALKFITSPLKKIGLPINFGPSPLDSHSTAHQIKKLFGKDFHNYYKFAFVRNPWERICSSYFYILKDKRHPAYHQTLNTKDINEFISKKIYIEKSQTEYIFDQDGNKLVDFIGRYENLESDFSQVLNHLKIQTCLKKLNSNKYNNYKDLLNEESIELINNRYENDISKFKYNFS